MSLKEYLGDSIYQPLTWIVFDIAVMLTAMSLPASLNFISVTYTEIYAQVVELRRFIKEKFRHD